MIEILKLIGSWVIGILIYAGVILCILGLGAPISAEASATCLWIGVPGLILGLAGFIWRVQTW